MLYLGCDQHRKQITISLRDEAGDVLERRQVSTQPQKVRAFLESVRQRSGEEGFMAIVEVCGFNDWFLALLGAYGCREVVLIHPAKPSKNKTDRRDAHSLGDVLWVNRDRLKNGQRVRGLRRVVVPSERDQADRQLTAARVRLGRQRTRTINKVQGILRKHNLGWEQPTKGIDTRTARRWLRGLELPEVDRLEMDLLLTQWELWDGQLEILHKTIAERTAANPAALRLCTMWGLAGYGALAVASRIGDIRRFPHPRSLSNYAGLAPRCRNSGDRTDRLGSITKEGSAIVRFILGQAVLHVLKKDRTMRQWYQRIKRRRGSKIARVAVMRRMCTIIWHMLTYDEDYQPGGPSRLKLRRQRELQQQTAPAAMGS